MPKIFYAFAHKFEEEVFIKQLDESTAIGISDALLVSDKETADAILDTYLSASHFEVVKVELFDFSNGVGEWSYNVPERWLE